MDPLWIGVIATGVGSLATGLPTFGTAVVNSVTARGQRAADKVEKEAQRAADAAEAKAQREFDEKARRRQFAADLLPERRAKIAYWQEHLFDAGQKHQEFVGYESAKPNVAGQRWLEDLCTHLTGEVAEDYRDLAIVRIDGGALSELSAEIARIEREWIAEAQG